MRTLAFDGRMGAAGDMVLGALIAAGADRSVLHPVEDALAVDYAVSTVDRNGISATRVEVLLAGADDDGHSDGHDAHHSDDDAHDSSDEHSHDHGHTHDHDGHTHAEGHGPTRSYAQVVDVVEAMDLPAAVETDALAIVEILGAAEASVHGTDIDDTHFHEVGADDAIADVVGAALLLDDLDVDRVVTTPLATGGGTVEMSHGTYPVPTPAVVEIAERADWSLQGGPVDAELLTPTGAAILAHVAEGVDRLPTLTVDSAGYGAGGWAFEDRPNVLRAMVGQSEGPLRRDDITVLETNLDDAPPELLGDLQRSLAAVGARDVSVLPATMKKSRPGHLVKVVCKPEDADRVARRLAEETGTLGVREHGAGHRWVADRTFETATLTVDGEAYEVTVKVASDSDGEVYDVSAEFDDAAAVADATDRPVREILRRAEQQVQQSD
ncbi:nickel pincer cofactor biosynthesis protein LarC [Haloarcula pellucida]|uniref:Putative nickel insertion protein n=1 Tax=Haloarcula pellucida TaxID=1427151 RepID=A0A830GR25_9EURY|nr:nickel pincer cofactor biosynthesis protein LarC [Halomicroarcula pellucida]MBX0348218.1 nickel pincer cofactor biosynthesis protein LarC [Halomicroarcula pellucida]GGN97540.1 TIGR00299 family protein [Halomicroarcula pellucida]